MEMRADTETDPRWMDARRLAAAIARRKLSPVEAVEAVLRGIEQDNPAINAYVLVMADAARADARRAEKMVTDGEPLGPLHGVPISVKDTTDVRGVPTTMGSRLRRHAVAPGDAAVVERLRRAGAIVVGKTNTPEFACKAVTDNMLFGPTRNPWATDLTPGGSSGGAAAAIAAGLGPLATSNDAGGSIRIPASCCGIFGIKPQFGRVPSYPTFRHWETLSHEGAMARTVSDAALMLDVIAGPHPADRQSLPPPQASFLKAAAPDVKGLRIAWSPDLGYATVGSEVQEAVSAALLQLETLGAAVEPIDLDLSDAEQIYLTLLNAELGVMVEELGPRSEIERDLHPLLISRADAGLAITARDYIRASFERRDFAARLARRLEGYDLLATPSIGLTAWPIDSPGGYARQVDDKPIRGLSWSLAHPFNLTGQPAASVPVGWSADGLPIGMQLVARYHDEAPIFRAAAAVEEAMPWAWRRPALTRRTETQRPHSHERSRT